MALFFKIAPFGTTNNLSLKWNEYGYDKESLKEFPMLRNMEPTLQRLSNITQDIKQWSLGVLLQEKTARRKTKIPDREFQCYVFVDVEGDKKHAISYMPGIAIVDKVLQPLKTYIVANARIATCSLELCPVDAKLQWIRQDCDRQKRHLDGSISARACSCAGLDHCFLRPLWNEFIKAEGANALSNTSTFPIIVALRVRAQARHFLPRPLQTSWMNQYILRQMHYTNGMKTNLSYLQQLLIERIYFNFVSSHSSVTHQAHFRIAKIIMTTDERCYTVQGHVELLHESKSIYYIACAKFTATNATISQEYTCNYCNKKQVASAS